jgi:hypothetical protein
MSLRLAVLFPALCFSTSALAQTLATPPTFRLVMPHGPGSVLIDTAGGWQLEHFALYDNGKRPVLQLNNDKLGLVASYILDYEPQYNDTSEMCRNDVLGTILHGPLAKATVTNKQSDTRSLKSGQTLVIGSYLIAKIEGIELNQENVFGFVAHNHTCAEIHLSRTPFKRGEERLFEAALDSFTYDPDYVSTPTDYALLAKLLPPGMAANYEAQTDPSPGSGQRANPSSEPPQSLTFALAEHTGYLHMDAPSFVITELSAKPNGHEFGIRAKDKFGVEVLGFLFLPEPMLPTATACRDWMMKAENGEHLGYRKITGQREMKSDTGVDIAIVEYEQSKTPSPSRYARRAFVAKNSLCADILLTFENLIVAATADPLLHTLVFDPARQPDFFAKFRYATVLYDHHQFAAAGSVYESALALVSTVNDPLNWSRVTTDQASMAFGISGNLVQSRALNEVAITKDPDYPLYYYNLACADAESGDATAARTHLQQAFDRRANTMKDEHLPDPTKDDSILKLKKDKAFWAFVQSLPKG